MGMLIDGKWQVDGSFPVDKKGAFARAPSSFTQQITADGSSGFTAEPHRYHVYFAYACPWASRVLIFRALKGLEDIISISPVNPLMLDNGWTFGAPHTPSSDPLFQSDYLYQIYLKADPHYTGKVTVPVLWDKKTQTIVNNESSQIIRMLNTEFNALTSNKEDFYPLALQAEIDKINTFVYDHINNGVYKCGFAQTQSAYEEAFDNLFSALETLEERLSQQRYLVGDKITEADWRLFTTLIRFDVVYYGHFKCNKKQLKDYPHLWQYLLALYQTPSIAQTVHFDEIKQHYYGSHRFLNPRGIIPKGPDIDFNEPSQRIIQFP